MATGLFQAHAPLAWEITRPAASSLMRSARRAMVSCSRSCSSTAGTPGGRLFARELRMTIDGAVELFLARLLVWMKTARPMLDDTQRTIGSIADVVR